MFDKSYKEIYDKYWNKLMELLSHFKLILNPF